MARVEIVAASDDKERAEALAQFLRQRGLMVWGEVGKPGFVPVGPDLAVVVLWSSKTTFSMQRMAIERRALDAWSEGRLILVRLDVHATVVGLRDLPAVELWRTVEPVAFQEVAQRVRAALAPPPEPPAPPAPSADRSGGPLGGVREEVAQEDAPRPVPAGSPRELDEVTVEKPGAPPAPVPAQSSAPRSSSTIPWVVSLLVVVLVGLVPLYAARNADLVSVLVPLGAVVGVAAVVFGGLALVRGGRRAAPEAIEDAFEGATTEKMPAAPRKRVTEAEDEQKPDDAPALEPLPNTFLFVSYAHADKPMVATVIDATKATGRNVWTDAMLPAGEAWAGEIVKAMKASEGVIVCCSTGAFESDHVKREVYLADRFKKRMLPVFLENIDPPDDFLYFFADRQWLFAHQVRPEELQAKLAAALAVAPA